MGKHRLDGVPPSEELLQRCAEAIVREWGPDGRIGGVTIEEARAAVERNFARRRRLGPELSAAQAWPVEPDPVIDLDAPPGDGWTLFLDHGIPVYGRAECHVQ